MQIGIPAHIQAPQVGAVNLSAQLPDTGSTHLTLRLAVPSKIVTSAALPQSSLVTAVGLL